MHDQNRYVRWRTTCIAARTTRSSVLIGYADLARALGLNPVEMLRRVGLDSRCLLDTELRIPVRAVAQLFELSAIESAAFDFGLRLAEARGVPDLGPISLLLREEPDLRSALASLDRYFSIHSTGLTVRLRMQAGVPILCADFVTAEPGPTRHAKEMIAAGLCNFLVWLEGPLWRPQMVCFSHAAPTSTESHRRIFGCPVEFDHDFDGIVLRAEDLCAPLVHADPMLRAHAERYLDTLVAANSAGFEDAVRELIAALLPIGRCSVQAVAQRLGVDRSTLTRRLARSGQSYSTMLQAARTGLASQRVGTGGSPLTSVADALGFSSLSAFSHWFQLSFGCSARAWRKLQKRDQDVLLRRPAAVDSASHFEPERLDPP